MAQECKSVLDNIVQNVSQVAQMVNDISSASKEQSVGVAEINRAIADLDQTNQSNSATAEKASQLSSNLSGRAQEASEAVNTLTLVVRGSSSQNETSKAPQPEADLQIRKAA